MRTRITGAPDMIRLALVFGALIAGTACSPAGTAPPPFGTLKISGTTSLNHPGETSQLTATLDSDGKTRDVTAEVEWKSLNLNVVTITRGGVLTAVGYGRALIRASHQPSSSVVSASVQVLPDGTFVLNGAVTEMGFPVAGARVQIASSSGTPSAMTDADGHYVLAPVGGDVAVRAEMDGFHAQVKQLTVDRDQMVDFELSRVDVPGDIRGAWRLIFAASPSCTLPTEAMQKDYTVRIEETQNSLVVVLSGVWWGDGTFTGSRDGNTVRFEIQKDYVYWDIDNHTGSLTVWGTASGAIKDRSIAATLNGTFELWAVSRTGSAPIGKCEAADHRLEFTR